MKIKERPILFSAPMVRAILEGRKTQTRRVIKPQPDEDGLAFLLLLKEWQDTGAKVYKCPQGVPRDYLWVREAWKIGAWDYNAAAVAIDYIADDFSRKEWLVDHNDTAADRFIKYMNQSVEDCEKAGMSPDVGGNYLYSTGCAPTRIRPSIHLPRAFSRIDLKITDIRVERLQDISEADAMAEGAEPHTIPMKMSDFTSYKMGFQKVWDSINGKSDYPWDANPWVWVVEFEVLKNNTKTPR